MAHMNIPRTQKARPGVTGTSERSALQFIWVCAANGTVVEDIPLWRAYTGQSRTEVQGLGWLHALHPNDYLQAVQAWTQAVARSSVYDASVRVRRADGIYHNFFVRGMPVTTEKGTVREWIGTCTAIATCRPRRNTLQQEELAQPVDQFETIFETMTDGVIVCDEQGQILKSNTASRAIMGADFQPDDYYKLSMQERASLYVMRDEYGRPLSAEQGPIMRLLRDEKLTGTNAMEVCMTTPDQREVQISVTGAPIRDKEGRITGTVCVFRDVTQRRKLERRTEVLAALIAMAETLVELPDTSVYVNEPKLISLVMHLVGQRIVELTHKVLRCQHVGMITIEPETGVMHPIAVLGYSNEQEQHFFNMLAGSQLREWLADPAMLACLQAGEIQMLHPVQPAWQRLKLMIGDSATLFAPICISNQLVGLLYTAYADTNHTYTSEEMELIMAVTKLSALAIERERREAEHEKLLVVLQEMNTQLEQVNKLQNDFISVVSHEFRTTLTGIQGFSELMRDEEFSAEEIKEYATDINTDAKRLTRMISELLDLERLKLGKMHLEQEAVDLNTVLVEVVERIRPITARHTFRLHMDGTVPNLEGDRDKLTQVVTNLLSNAVKYSPAGGEIVLTCILEDTVVHLSVQDHGVGIPADALERIFMQYNRLEADTTRYIKGTGLGLPMVRQIVQMHGGHVWVESTTGHGSTFHIALPLIHVLLIP